jgi:hypothetical protein
MRARSRKFIISYILRKYTMKIFKSPFILTLLLLLLTTCEYEEDTTSASSNAAYRLSSMNVTGTVDSADSKTFVYNSSGDLDTILTKDENGDTTEHAEYEYSSDGTLLKSIITIGSETLITTNTYVNGYKTESVVVDQNYDVQNYIYYTYDSSGRLAKKEVCNSSNTVTGTITYSYEEDTVLSSFSAVYLEYLLQQQ